MIFLMLAPMSTPWVVIQVEFGFYVIYLVASQSD
jgi:hypothetical protein